MSSDPFLSQLAGLCRVNPTGAKWVVVPAHAIGLTLGERLAREGTDWANLRFVTPLDLATRMAAPFLVEQGIDPSEDTLGPALAMRLLLALPEEGGYFRRMGAQPSMSAALWRTVRELRFAGLRAADLRPEAFVSPRKHAEMRALFEAYERHLADNRLADTPAVFEQALRHPDWCPVGARDVVVEWPEAVWPPLVRRFLDALPGQREAPHAPALPGVTCPARATSLMAPAARVEAPYHTDAARLRFLQAPAAAGPARGDGTLDLFHAGGHDAEIDEVLRRILASGRPLDQVEIACASNAGARLAWEKTIGLGWPVTLSTGLPAAATRPGRLLLHFAEWLAGGFRAADLRRMLQSGDCAPRAFDAAGTAPALSALQAARLLLDAQATRGRDACTRALTRLTEECDRRVRDAEAEGRDEPWHARRAAHARTLATWLDEVLARIPAPGEDGTIAVDALADAAVAFLDGNACLDAPLDVTAATALTAALRELRTLGAYHCDPATAATFLTARVDDVDVGHGRPRPGHLHISTMPGAGLDGRALVFVTGLQEGGVFPAAVEDPVLIDEERRRLHPSLSTSMDRIDETVLATVGRLAAIGLSAESVCLSASCRDTRALRETFPSWLLLQAFRLREGDASLAHADLERRLGEPVSAVPATPGDAVSAAGWWLAACAATPAARPGILRAFPSLARGVRAERARDSAEFTEFDGCVPEAGPLLDPSRTGRHVSATTLENAAKCPYRYFLEQGLGVRPIEEVELEADAWLSPLTRGSELHELFARFVRILRDEERQPKLPKDLPLLRAWGEARLAALRADLPPPSDEVFAREREEFLDDLEAFLIAEMEGRHGQRPVGLEVGFGLPPDASDREPLSSGKPLALNLGARRRLHAHGRIDRINRGADGTCEVIDYKTGGYWSDAWQGVFAGGTRLQHAIYGRAAEALLAARGEPASVARAIYVFPALRGHRQRKVIEAPAPGALETVLRQLLDTIGAGAFAVAEDRRACWSCEFARACHALDPAAPGSDDSGATRSTQKLENPVNTILDALRKLRSHE